MHHLSPFEPGPEAEKHGLEESYQKGDYGQGVDLDPTDGNRLWQVDF
ncbi:predicted nucleotidyltransferases [Moorella thermoacetica Y72]|uniref:Predicted nucleotidyltransferases n=1 Tax=Moorella thermoacetica Y72 TaxID=1325331 RepID=A0A0S6UCG1_NEOTH|nr:predicted nucleotidyltransferases [Moorella thermoacetica Y72]